MFDERLSERASFHAAGRPAGAARRGARRTIDRRATRGAQWSVKKRTSMKITTSMYRFKMVQIPPARAVITIYTRRGVRGQSNRRWAAASTTVAVFSSFSVSVSESARARRLRCRRKAACRRSSCPHRRRRRLGHHRHRRSTIVSMDAREPS